MTKASILLFPIAVLLSAGAPLAAQTSVMEAPASRTRLDLREQGQVSVVPDLVMISAGVTTEARDAAGAMRDNAQRMARVIAAIRKAGIAERDIQTQSVALSPQYRYSQNEAPVLTGYQASTMLTLRFRDIARSGAILDALVAEGVNQINGPSFTVENPGPAEDKARVQALSALKARAALYAKSLNMKVGRIVSISEAMDYARPPMPMLARAVMAEAVDAKTEINAGEQIVSVTVSAVFELE